MKSTGILLALSMLVWFNPLFAAKSYPLLEAVELGLITVTVEGKGDHVGKTLSLKVENLQKKTLEIVLEAGLKFHSFDTIVQDLILTKGRTFEIDGHATRRYSLYGMCIQQNNVGPGAEELFSLGIMAESPLLDVAQYISQKNYQNSAGQSALWAVTDGAKIASIHDDDPAVTKDLQLFMSKLLDKPLPWYSIQYRDNPDPRVVFTNNPAVVHAKFRYQLDKQTTVSLAIFDSTGTVVKMIGENMQQRPATHELKFKWETSHIPHGIYYVRVYSDEAIIEEKAIEL